MDFIQTEVNNHGIMTITLNRPDKLNALSTALLIELDTLLDRISVDDAVKAIILTGSGKAFCAGADINRLRECNVVSGYEFAKQGQRIFKKLESLSKPSIAAVNGFAFGGGCELAMSATLRIASSKAQFGQPEVKLGVIPGYGGTQRLARLVGKGRAMDLCLTGRFIDAKTALDWGLVTYLCEPQELLDKAHDILSGILAMGPQAIASTMDVIHHGFDLTLDDALHLEAVHFGRVCGTLDKNRGVDAFLNKTSAEFKGD